ncbi:MAG TPA: DUF4349 domain-containing protein [Anaerolineales bacterium]|nr:DUF4349 domain-containing protein [Anaerolineales bacterium]
MKRTLFIILSVLAVFLILGTAMMRLAGPKVGYTFSTVNHELPGESQSFGYGGGAPDVFAPAPAEAPAFDSAEERSSTKNYAAAQSAQAQERLVIQSAELAIVVTDPRASLKQISDLANEYGGFVVSSNMDQSYSPAGKEIPEGSVVIRVPSEKLDEALERIKKGAVDVQSEKRSGQDVTSQYVDLQSQLKAKQAAVEKLLEIMDQATRAEDVLNAYVQVQQVQTEIEQLKGQIKYLEESAALSAINVRLIAEEGTQPIEVGPWKPSGAAKAAIQNLIVFFQNFIEFLITFVLYILPALIMIAIPLYLIYLGGRALYRRTVKAENKNKEETKG